MTDDELIERVARAIAGDDFAQRDLYECAKDSIAAVREAEAGEIDRLRAELADGSFYKESDIDRMQSHIALLRGAVHALLECPHIADRDPYPWNEPATEVAVDRARAALQETDR